MFDLVIALLGLGVVFARNQYRELQELHAVLSRYFSGLIVLLLVGFGLNLIGWGGVNLVFMLLLSIAMVILATYPGILIGVAGFGATTGGFNVAAGNPREWNNIPKAIATAFERYVNFMVDLMFWISVGFFILGTISFRNNPWAFVVVCSCGVIISIVSFRRKKESSFDKSVKAYAYIILLVAIFSLIPSAGYKKIIGVDPFAFFKLSQTEVVISEGESANEEFKEKNELRKAEILAARIKKVGYEELTSDEKIQWDKLKEKRDSKTLPSKISNTAAEIAESFKSSGKNKVGPGSLPNEEGKSRTVQFEKEAWAVRYRLGDDWYGPVVPKGRYLLWMEKDVVLEVMADERQFEIKRGKQEIDVCQDFSQIKFHAPEKGGETVKIKIKRIGG